MRTFYSKIKIDRAVGAAENASTGEEKMSDSSKKIPWYLRFAPGAILRQIGLAVLTLTMLFGVQTAQAQITIDSLSSPVYISHGDGTGHYEVNVYVFGLGPDSDIYNYPQWYAPGIWIDNPNSDLDLTTLRAKIASINATFASDLSSALGSYMDSIDSATAAFVSATNACLLRNESRTTLVNCPMTAWGVWMATMSNAISTLESSMASATKTANDTMEAWMNYIN